MRKSHITQSGTVHFHDVKPVEQTPALPLIELVRALDFAHRQAVTNLLMDEKVLRDTKCICKAIKTASQQGNPAYITQILRSLMSDKQAWEGFKVHAQGETGYFLGLLNGIELMSETIQVRQPLTAATVKHVGTGITTSAR